MKQQVQAGGGAGHLPVGEGRGDGVDESVTAAPQVERRRRADDARVQEPDPRDAGQTTRPRGLATTIATVPSSSDRSDLRVP
jgi:hypothetical protein